VKLPDNTRAFFSVSLTKRPRKVKATREKKESDARERFNQKLRNMGRRERRLSKSRDVTFSMIPARSREYYVTVHGPLYHSISEQLIGDFLEERTITVTRGRTANVEFDLQPKDCAVEVMVYHGERALNGAQVAVLGEPQSLRYTNNGAAFLYLPKGQHTIVAGARDRAGEREVNIESYDPLPLMIDLASEGGLTFKSCTEAVQPFLEGNFDAAAIALESADQMQLAQMMRARSHQLRGDIAAASKALEQAGQLTQAADLLAAHDERGASASLYEEAGEFERAAEIHRASGDLVAAARAYEAGYDYANATECYRELGDLGAVLGLLEKCADHFEAGKLAIELGENARAIQNLQQVEKRHPSYSEACLQLATVLIDEDNQDFAIEKLDEVVGIGSLESIPIDMRARYGAMLETSGRFGDAVAALQSVRREDAHYRGVNERIEALKLQLTRLEDQQTRVTHGAQANTSATELSGESRYEILEQVGAGGMGVVYKAKDKHLGRLVAMKRLPENLREHPAALKFFEREARSAAVLNHPNIVTVYDAGQDGGQYFITMELLEGTPLDAIIKKRGALPPLVVAQLGIQIATGLHFAHRNKIIHRDIKTANLFLTRDKIVKIMDFGLAKMVEEVRKGATVIGGTPYFMAPEQAAGEENVDHRADLYALGITLYQLSTGALPFTEGDVSYHHRHTPPPDPREFNAELPPALAELILHLIQKRPDDRVQKAADVVRVLQSLVDGATARRGPHQS
jgi:tRNA A-37 threonylcarbamoyl transferase component Bud32